MDLIEAIKTRKSVRGYKSTPVSKEIIAQILETATRSPSALNTQPWEFTVITGEPLDKIRQANVQFFEAGTPENPDIPTKKQEGVYRQRQVDLAIQLFQLLDIKREDREKRNEWTKKGLRLFNAPVLIVVSLDKSLEMMAVCDVGAITQTIALTALNFGLGTCVMGAGVMYAEPLRKYAGIPDTKRMVLAIAMGYPDWDFQGNKLQSKREPYQNITQWVGF